MAPSIRIVRYLQLVTKTHSTSIPIYDYFDTISIGYLRCLSFTVFDLLGIVKISIVYAFMSKTYPQKVPFGFIRKIVINIGICPHSFTEPFTIVSFGWLKGILS